MVLPVRFQFSVEWASNIGDKRDIRGKDTTWLGYCTKMLEVSLPVHLTRCTFTISSL